MTDEYRSLGLGLGSFRMDGGIPSRLRPFGEPVRTVAVGHELDSDTFALWRFNETDDVSEGLNYAQSLTATYSKRALEFGGTNEYVTMGDVSELAFERTDAFSVSCWFRSTSTATESDLISKALGSPTWRGYDLTLINTGALNFDIISDWSIANRIRVETTTTGYNDGAWHHIVVTYDGSSAASGVTIYIDGSSVATTTVYDTLTATIVAASSFNIGAVNNGTYPFIGSIDEVCVHRKELSAAEVTALYNGGVPTDPRVLSSAGRLVGYWPCGDGDTYPTITDRSSSGNDGTMTNMETTDISREVPAGRMLAPSTLSSWTFVPPVVYGPGGRKQPCRWFRGAAYSSNFERAADPEFVSLLTSDFTIEVWVYVENLADNTNHTVFEYSNSGGDAEIYNYLQRVIVQSDGKINLFWEYGAGVNANFTTVSAYITSGTWYHLAVTHVVSAGNRTCKIYVDGDYKEQYTDSNATGGTSSLLYIGVNNLLANELYGALADMRLSSKERTATEIAVSAAATDFRHVLDADTFALWRFDEPPVVSDEAGNFPLQPSSFTTGPGIEVPLVLDGGRARGIGSTSGGLWGPSRSDILSLLASGEYTVEFWFRYADGCTSGSFTPSNSLSLFAFGGSGETEADNFLIQFQILTSLQLYDFWESGAGVNHSITTTNPVLKSSELWVPHHVAITKSIPNSTIQCYVDGELKQEFTGLTNPTGATATNATCYISTAGPAFTVDDMRISSKIRTAQEIAASYARGTPVGTVARYRKRARDSGATGVVYVTWETTDPDGTYPGILPGGGPLVDEVILDKFQV